VGASTLPDKPVSSTTSPPSGDGTDSPDVSPAQLAAIISAVQIEANQRAQELMEYLKGSDFTNIISKINTDSIRLSPIYTYRTENEYKSVMTGYSASYSVSFRVTVVSDKSGDILAGLTEHGSTSIDGISFVASESVLDEGKNRALRLATEKAVGQLQTIVSALNSFVSTNGQPTSMIFHSLNVQDTYYPRPMPYYSGESGAAADASISAAPVPSAPVEGGTMEISAIVNVKVRI